MDEAEDAGQAAREKDTTTRGSDAAASRPFGPDAAAILATEHWGLLSSRALIWNEAISRTTVYLSVLSAAIIALALLADATGFGGRTATLALILLPVVLFLGVATHLRLIAINGEEVKIMLAMNRLRNAYLKMAPALEPYFTTGHHDDERGLSASYLLGSAGMRPWAQYFQATPTIVATLNAALAAAIVVLLMLAVEAPAAVVAAVGAAAFVTMEAILFSLQRRAIDRLRHSAPRFPTPNK
jgi:hypothetical protein